jgi:peptidoglycan-associated lipoprotein
MKSNINIKSNVIRFINLLAVLLLSMSMLAGCSALRKHAAASSSAPSAQSYGAISPLSFHPKDRTLAPQNDTYYFKYDNDEMSAADVAAANVQANYLATHPKSRVRLEGNTDNRGSAEYNISLGWRRAQSVAQRLEMQGVHPDQIKIVSYGKERPAVMGNSAAVYSKNRRVNLVYEVSNAN